VTRTFQHINGHQDKHKKALNLEVQLNVCADQLAKKGLQLPNIQQYDTPGLQVTLRIKYLMINAHYFKTMHYVFHSAKMRDYYTSKNKYHTKPLTEENNQPTMAIATVAARE
jgi:hypothetical protein